MAPTDMEAMEVGAISEAVRPERSDREVGFCFVFHYRIELFHQRIHYSKLLHPAALK